uniref:Myoinhibiting peptide n=1 Tax=Lygus hesperus TaxID=30085 RepID=W8FR52_LYGHE|nr:myoinhibiting peptide precursor [Lygus hesperus]
MLQLIITILVGLATLACTQCYDNNKVRSLPDTNEEDRDAKVVKRSTECGNTGWQDPKSDSEKRAWNNMQATWGKRKWQDMQNPGWGKRTPTPPEFDKDIQASLQTSFQEDKRGWKDMQGPSWGKRGWQDMRQPSWGKRGWKDMQTSAWGKRGWQDMQGQWGKRGWQDMQGNWGKRGWQDMQGLNWGKRRWQDMPTSAWGKRGWKELQTTGWGKRDALEDQMADKRGWGDMKISGYGKRAWNDIQSSGWGKRGWKEMPSTGWGKRSPQDHEDFDDLEEDWELPSKSEVDIEDLLSAAEWPLGKEEGANRNDRHLYEPLDDQALFGKILEGLYKASWTNRNFNPKNLAEEAGTSAQRNR